MPWTAPRTWTTGEIVTASIMNTHVRDNFNETVPAKAVAAGDLFYAVGMNAITRLPPGTAWQMLRMNSAGVAPEWTNPPGIYVPLMFTGARTSGSYGPMTAQQWTFRGDRVPTGYTAYLVVIWRATVGSPARGNASIGLRNLTANTDVWRITLPPPVDPRQDRTPVSLTHNNVYQMWGNAEQDGQLVEGSAYLEFV